MSETQREDGEHKPLVCGGYLWHDSPLERRASAASHTSTYLSCQCCHEHSCLFCEMKHVMNDSNYPVSMTASASGSARYHSSPILLRTPPQKRFLQNPSITSNHASALDMQRDANSLQSLQRVSRPIKRHRTTTKHRMSKHEAAIQIKC